MTTGIAQPAPPAQQNEPIDPTAHPIVFFDGDCAFCNCSVMALVDRDAREKLRFAPLQGSTAKGRVPEEDRKRLDSLVLLDNEGVSRHSTAVVRILGHLGGRYRVLSFLLWLIPAFLRNTGYKLVARFRHYLAKKSSCRMPTASERRRIYP